jgi:hypothetical protein
MRSKPLSAVSARASRAHESGDRLLKASAQQVRGRDLTPAVHDPPGSGGLLGGDDELGVAEHLRDPVGGQRGAQMRERRSERRGAVRRRDVEIAGRLGNRGKVPRFCGFAREERDPGARERELRVGRDLLGGATPQPGTGRLDLTATDIGISVPPDDASGARQVSAGMGVLERLARIAVTLMPRGGSPQYCVDDVGLPAGAARPEGAPGTGGESGTTRRRHSVG